MFHDVIPVSQREIDFHHVPLSERFDHPDTWRKWSRARSSSVWSPVALSRACLMQGATLKRESANQKYASSIYNLELFVLSGLERRIYRIRLILTIHLIIIARRLIPCRRGMHKPHNTDNHFLDHCHYLLQLPWSTILRLTSGTTHLKQTPSRFSICEPLLCDVAATRGEAKRY